MYSFNACKLVEILVRELSESTHCMYQMNTEHKSKKKNKNIF